MRRIFAMVLCVVMIISCSLNVFAAGKSQTSYKVFTGTVPDLGIIVSWGVHFDITANYTNAGTPYRLTKLYTSAYISPKRTDTSNGSITGSVTQTTDYGNTVTRSLLSAFWSNFSGVYPGNSYVYFGKQGTLNKTFYYQATEKGSYTFMNNAAILYNRNHSFTLTIAGPK